MLLYRRVQKRVGECGVGATVIKSAASTGSTVDACLQKETVFSHRKGCYTYHMGLELRSGSAVADNEASSSGKKRVVQVFAGIGSVHA